MQLPDKAIEQQIVRGAILHSTMFEDIDHGKFFVIVGVTQESVAGFFFINSAINRAVMGKPEQLAMQYPMRRADYPFLKYDSFLCATAIVKRPRSHIVRTMQDGTTRFVGTMLDRHMDELLQAARASRLFSKVDKETFFY